MKIKTLFFAVSRLKQYFLCFSILGSVTIYLSADNYCGYNLTWTYTTADSTLTISGSGKMYNYLNTYAVPWQSTNCYNGSKIVIEEGVTSIGTFAFGNEFTSVSLPQTLTHIEENAFSNCGISSIAIPAKVSYIASSAFSVSNRLVSINIDSDNQNYTSSNGALYNKACTELICCPAGKTGDFYLPASVEKIGFYGFYKCHLTSITVADENENYASADGILYNKTLNQLISCPTGRTDSVIIPDGVTQIGNRAFQYGKLSFVSIPGSVINIGDYAFYACPELTTVSIADGVDTIGNNVFRSRGNLVSVQIPGSVVSIGHYLFHRCTALSEITLSDSIKNIKGYTFFGCYNLTTVIMGKNITKIGMYAFGNCRTLASITIKAPIPPAITNGCFMRVNTAIPLYVPAKTKASYEAADYWKTFTNIIELKDESTDISQTTTEQGFSMQGNRIVLSEQQYVSIYNTNGSCIFSGTANYIVLPTP